MTGEAQHGASAAVTRPEVFDRAERHALDAEAVGLQALSDDLQAAVIFGADGGAADQILGEGERGVGVGRQSQGLQLGQGRCGRGLIAKTSRGGKPLLLREYYNCTAIRRPKRASRPCRVTRMSSTVVTLRARWPKVKSVRGQNHEVVE